MCGITGIFETRGKNEIERDVLARMNESQHHRGPDEGGYHVEPGVGLGHRRLSIIDVATGQQPLFNEDGSVVVIYNGEIYNYQELIPELVALGHVFRTKSDTEVIVHAWEAWGEALRRALPRHVRIRALGPQSRNALPRPRQAGCKAAVLRVPARRQVHLRIRAQVAARPRRAGHAISIRSAVEEYFALGYVPEPRTIFSGAAKLPPAHTLTLRRGAAVDAPKEYLGCPVHAGQPDKLRGRRALNSSSACANPSSCE